MADILECKGGHRCEVKGKDRLLPHGHRDKNGGWLNRNIYQQGASNGTAS